VHLGVCTSRLQMACLPVHPNAPSQARIQQALGAFCHVTSLQQQSQLCIAPASCGRGSKTTSNLLASIGGKVHYVYMPKLLSTFWPLYTTASYYIHCAHFCTNNENLNFAIKIRLGNFPSLLKGNANNILAIMCLIQARLQYTN
jgi:hypothetical protein